ncbi:hypothetical protein V1525DRAFT_411799 [Lipomyces kononenkoae]|uniref:Uncharacterized protein n=1 Tax=Lipomyces kononenkoae TaxID=34357 RepID=A0ACC3STA3_LIPKO
MADYFARPNGLCFSPDLKRLYITDTGAIHGSSTVPVDLTGPSHIAFDIVLQDGPGQTRAPPLSRSGRTPKGLQAGGPAIFQCPTAIPVLSQISSAKRESDMGGVQQV